MRRKYFNQGSAGRDYSSLTIDNNIGEPGSVEFETEGESDVQLNSAQLRDLVVVLRSFLVGAAESESLWEDRP
jgi:hypothetical protein